MIILLPFFIVFTLVFSVSAEDIKIIELHNQTIDQILLNESNKNKNVKKNETDEINKKNEINIEELKEEKNDIISSEVSSTYKVITALPDFWEKADKGELLFLLDNLKNTNSLVLDNILINKFTANSLPPQGFEEDEFNHFKIIN